MLQDANNHGARLLLNVADSNEAKSLNSSMSTDERQEKMIAATRQMGQLFVQTHQKLSPVALSLIRNTEVQGQIDKVSYAQQYWMHRADEDRKPRRLNWQSVLYSMLTLQLILAELFRKGHDWLL